MSSIGRRQANADQEKLDLSKKTIRDVAVELARRSQPAVTAGQSADGPAAAGAGIPTAGSAGDNPAGNSAQQPAEETPSNLIQMDPRAGSAPRSAASNLWSLHRPFSDDTSGRAPLEALSRALDQRLFEQQDEIGLTPSSEMTTDLAPAPMVVPPSASHPTVDGTEMPLQESEKNSASSSLDENPAPRRPALRHYPAPRYDLLRRWQARWLGQILPRRDRARSAPMQPAAIHWSTLGVGLAIGLLVGAGAVALLHPSSTSSPIQSAVSQPSAPSLAAAPASTPSPTARPASAARSSAGAQATAGQSAAGQSMGGQLHAREMTATTFGIPFTLQAGRSSPAAGGAVPPSLPASAAGTSKTSLASPGGAPALTETEPSTSAKPKPVKAKARSSQKSATGQHPAPAPTEELTPAKR